MFDLIRVIEAFVYRVNSTISTAGITSNPACSRQAVASHVTPDTGSIAAILRGVLALFVDRHPFQQATSNHIFSRAPSRFERVALVERLHTVKQVGNAGHVQWWCADLARYPIEVIRLKVAEYLFFAAGHSHGWLIP